MISRDALCVYRIETKGSGTHGDGKGWRHAGAGRRGRRAGRKDGLALKLALSSAGPRQASAAQPGAAAKGLSPVATENRGAGRDLETPERRYLRLAIAVRPSGQ